MNILEAKHILKSVGFNITKQINEDIEDDDYVLPDHLKDQPEPDSDDLDDVEDWEHCPGYPLAADEPADDLADIVDEDEIAESVQPEKIVRSNGHKFIKNSKKYAGNHPVFSSKDFQDYLLKECGTDCLDDDCKDCCPDCGNDECTCKTSEGDKFYEIENALDDMGLDTNAVAQIMSDSAEEIAQMLEDGMTAEEIAAEIA